VNKSILELSAKSTGFTFKEAGHEDIDDGGDGGDGGNGVGNNNLNNFIYDKNDPNYATTNIDQLIKQKELRSKYSSFVKYFEQLLERENEQVENAIYTLYYKCQDIFIIQSHYTILNETNTLLFTNDWWVMSDQVSKWLDCIHVQIYNTFIGLHVDMYNITFIKQYLRKIIKNICYIYVSRFLACFYFDKKRPDFITNILKQTRQQDYSFTILLDKIFKDMSMIISWCKELEGRLPPHITHLYENELSMHETIKIDTTLLSQFFTLCEYDDVNIMGNFNNVYNNITGTKYICEQMVSSVYNNQCIVTIGSLIYVLFSLKCVPKNKITNTLSMIIQTCNQITQQKLQSLNGGNNTIMNNNDNNNNNNNNNTTTQPNLNRTISKQLQAIYNSSIIDDNGNFSATALQQQDDDYESIFKHTNLRLSILIETGRGLAAKNTDGVTSDPYVVVKLLQGRVGGGNDSSKVMEKKRTSSVTANINPDWYEWVTFPSLSLLFTDSIELSIYDSNWLSKDVNMGDLRISRHSIEQRCIQMRKDNWKGFKSTMAGFHSRFGSSQSGGSSANPNLHHNNPPNNNPTGDSSSELNKSSIFTPNNSNNSNNNNNNIFSDDKYTYKRDEMLYQLEASYNCKIWGYCTEKFALTIPNRGNLTCTFVLVEDE
jgi:hypothetical protein